jgi:hypothetical protein
LQRVDRRDSRLPPFGRSFRVRDGKNGLQKSLLPGKHQEGELFAGCGIAPKVSPTAEKKRRRGKIREKRNTYKKPLWSRRENGCKVGSRKIAPFNFESTAEQENLTAKPGGILLAELFHATGCAAAADATGVRRNRGYSAADHVFSAVLLNALGFDASDDLGQLRSDGALVSAVNQLNAYQTL